MLHLHETSSSATLLAFTNTTTGSAASDGALIGIQDNESLIVSNKENNHIEFHTNNTERLRIRAGGPHLLIGTGGDATYNEITESSSNAGLVIGSSSIGNGGIVIRNSTSGTGRIYFADNSGSDPGRQRGQINYYHNGDYMMFATAGSQRLRIDSSGNVTLGYTGSSLYFQNGFNDSASRIQNGGASNSANLKFYVRDSGTESEHMRLTEQGGLSICRDGSLNTTAGNETIYIQGEGHNGHGTGNTRSVVSIIGAISSNNAGMGIWIGARTNENTAVIGTRTASGNLAIETYNGGWGERLRITSAGLVGVGVASPSLSYGNGIHIAGGNAGLKLQNTNNGDWAYVEYADESNTTKFIQGYRDSSGVYAIRPGTTLNATPGISLTSAGQVIVNGTENLAHPNMDDIIVGDASGNRGITISSGTSNFGTVAFGDSADGSGTDRYAGFVEYYHNDNSMRLGTSSAERLRITSDGSIGVGAYTPVTDVDISQKTGAVALPQGTTAQRPSGSAPYIRKNTTNNALEFYNGTEWVEIITDYFPTGSTILG